MELKNNTNFMLTNLLDPPYFITYPTLHFLPIDLLAIYLSFLPNEPWELKTHTNYMLIYLEDPRSLLTYLNSPFLITYTYTYPIPINITLPNYIKFIFFPCEAIKLESGNLLYNPSNLPIYVLTYLTLLRSGSEY